MKSAGRGSVAQLNAKYEQELNAYLEMYSYDSDRIFYLANEYMLLNNYHRANKIFLKDNKDIKNVFGLLLHIDLWDKTKMQYKNIHKQYL